jgi:choline kinase
MKAIILAAGRGMRMGQITQEHPKCLTQLLGRPLLEWQLQALRGAGISQIAVVSGYMQEKLRPYPLEVFSNLRWQESNMVVSLICAEKWLSQDDCIVSYSDIVYPSATISALMGAPTGISITYDVNWLDLWGARFSDPLSDAETFIYSKDTQKLLEIGNRSQTIEQIQGQYMGLLKFSPSGWRAVQDYLLQLDQSQVDKLDMTSLLRGLLTRKVPVHTVPIKGQWYEVDSFKDLQLYEQQIKEEKSWMCSAMRN